MEKVLDNVAVKEQEIVTQETKNPVRTKQRKIDKQLVFIPFIFCHPLYGKPVFVHT